MSASLAATSVQYQVQSDLNRECLPQSNRDPQRKVWWMNSVAASVLGIGVFLTKEPAEFIFRPIEPEAPMQVEIVQPHVEQVVPVDRPPEDEVVEEVEVAVIQPVVVAADPSKVAFAVEVKGPTVTSANLAKVSPPPAIVQRPKPQNQATGPVVIRAGQEGIPAMQNYPIEAQRAGIEGSFTLRVMVAADGTIDEIAVLKSTGALLLERAAKEHVRRFARLGNGQAREVHVPFDFKLK